MAMGRVCAPPAVAPHLHLQARPAHLVRVLRLAQLRLRGRQLAAQALVQCLQLLHTCLQMDQGWVPRVLGFSPGLGPGLGKCMSLILKTYRLKH